MRIDERFLNWGLFFILLGAVPLAVQQGALDRNAVSDLWRLWPLIIVGIGAGILLKRTPAAFAGGLIVAATFGLMIGGAFATGGVGDLGNIACAGTGNAQPFSLQSAPFTQTSASVEVNQDCGDLNVTTISGAAWTLTGSAANGQPPNINASNGRLVIDSRPSGGGPVFGRTHENWSLAVPGSVTTSLDATINAGRGVFDLAGAQISSATIHGNAGDLRLDLANTPVGDVNLSINAGSGHVNLPAASMHARFEVNAGSIAFCVPDGVGLRISTNDNITAGNNFGSRGLSKSGSTWQSAGYDGSSAKIDIDASANAGGFTLNPEEGCR